MEPTLINALGTLGFGGGGIALVAYFSYHYGKEQLTNHKTEISRICDSFDRALDRRDRDIDLLISEIRITRETAP